MLGKVEICGVNTAELKVLSGEECRALLLRAKQGDSAAREALIAGNLRLVLSVLQRFVGRGENVDDLFQVGCIGLIKAIDNFDAEAHDVRFSTYGVPMIAGEIRRYLRDNSAVRVSRSMRDTAYHVLQAKEKLTAATGREPTMEEIAKELGIPLEYNLQGNSYRERGRYHGIGYPHDAFWSIAAQTGNQAIIGIDAHHADMLSWTDRFVQAREHLTQMGLEVLDSLGNML